jgi:hypothetical protein
MEAEARGLVGGLRHGHCCPLRLKWPSADWHRGRVRSSARSGEGPRLAMKIRMVVFEKTASMASDTTIQTSCQAAVAIKTLKV